MSSKKLDPQIIMNELRGQSAFFKKEETPPPPPPTTPNETESRRTEIRTDNRSEMRSQPFPTRRLTRRYSFEFYDDQITRVKGIKHDLEMQGERISMSDIVRDALDEYLNKNSDQERTDIRSEIRTNETSNG